MRAPGLERLAQLATQVRPERPETCTAVLRELGPLGPWLLAPAVLEAAGRDNDAAIELRTLAAAPLTPPDAPGSATLLLALPPGSPCAGLLRPAFALPVRWIKGPHGRLPAALRAVANDVRLSVGARDWGLDLDPDKLGRELDLTGWLPEQLSAESGWVTLAAALLVACCEGARSNPRVLATATWGEAGVGGVDPNTLAAKVDAAVALGARLLFVGEADEAAANAAARGRVEVRGLRAGNQRAPRQALCELLFELEVPPRREDPLPERLAYHKRVQALSRVRALDYYAAYLVEDLTQACAVRSIEGWPAAARAGRLVTFLSTNPEGALFALRTLAPRHVLLIYTDQSAPHLATFREAAEASGSVVQPASMGDGQDEHRAAAAMATFLAETPDADTTVIDVTPGPKHVTVALVQAAPPGALMVYMEQCWRGREREPGGECLRVLGCPVSVS